MKSLRPIDFLRIPLVLAALLVGFHAAAADAQSFTITATNVTINASGTGSSQFTITNIPLTGTLELVCAYSGLSTEAKLPICPLTPPARIPVNSGGSLTGAIGFVPYGSIIPLQLHELHHDRTPLVGLALAAALFFVFRRRSWLWPAMVLLAMCSLAALAGVSACGGSSPASMTPGAYPYTITAYNETNGPAPLGVSASTTIYVTVP
jgi:hypothetical protein